MDGWSSRRIPFQSHDFMLMKCTSMLIVQQLAARIVVALRFLKLAKTDGLEESPQSSPIHSLLIIWWNWPLLNLLRGGSNKKRLTPRVQTAFKISANSTGDT